MARRYEVKELLHLRNSPLTCKPSTLPPAEEWMGPVPEQIPRKSGMPRLKLDGSTPVNEIRPSLSAEARHSLRGSTTVPSDIVLGPPKTAFASAFASASAAKSQTKVFNSPARPSFSSYSSDAQKAEYRNGGSRNREDREAIESRDDMTKEPRDAAVRHGQEGGEGISTFKPTKDSGESGVDGNIRRDVSYENDPIGGKWTLQRSIDNSRRDNTRHLDEGRRSGPGRGGKPAWFKDDGVDSKGDGPLDPMPDRRISKDWRENERSNRRGFEREWGKTAKAEQDPEWMLEAKEEDKKQTHTAEDIEQWKASMKAQAAAERKASHEPQEAEQSSHHIRSGSSLSGGARKVDQALGLDSGLDKFFHMWNEPQTDQNPSATKQDDAPKQANTRPNTLQQTKSSKFSGFFNAEPPVIQDKVESLLTPSQEAMFGTSSNEDKAGFQRILKMLGGGNILLGGAENAASRPTGGYSGGMMRGDMPPTTVEVRTPPRSPQMNERFSPPPILSPRSRKAHGLEGLLGLQSPNEGSLPTNSDSQFLLNLMKRPTATDTTGPSNPQRGPFPQGPGVLPYPNPMTQQRMSQASPENGFYEPMMQDNARQRDKLNPSTSANMRAQGGPPSFEEEMYFRMQSEHHPGMGPPSHFGLLPPGLQRPPGFDHFPPEYGQNIQPRGNMVPPPPGFPAPVRNAVQASPGLIPNLAALNMAGDRNGPYGGRYVGPGPGPGPGGPPPLGYMSVAGPPPGFPPMGMPPPDGRMSPSGRMMYGNGPGRLPVNPFAEQGYGHAGPGSIPTQFRRQD